MPPVADSKQTFYAVSSERLFAHAELIREDMRR
jgi:hypothetical protein